VITLALDASTYRGSVAILDQSRLLVETTVAMRGKDSELLMPAIDRVLRDAGTTYEGLGRVVCGGGPGSFTSLRIAASLAKGIAVARGLPLYSVSSLALIVAGNVSDGPRGTRRYLAAQDAMRGESYVAEFEHEAGAVRQVGDLRLMDSHAVQEHAERTNARAVGPELPDQWVPHARGLALLIDAVLATDPVPLPDWEPVYGRLAEAQVKWEAAHGRPLPG
jgi:tRNA threonylcarbamoyladenosine biosynthesis protein TsaB